MSMADELRDGLELEHWAEGAYENLTLPADDRSVIPAALYHLVMELHGAVVNLVQHGRNGAAATLLRPCFETLVRASWIQHAASAEQIERYKKDDVPKMPALMKALQVAPFGAWFKSMYDFAWSSMCSYAHGGVYHAARRVGEGEIVQAYSETMMVEVVKLAGCCGLFSLIETALLAQNDDLVAEAIKKLDAWYPDLRRP